MKNVIIISLFSISQLLTSCEGHQKIKLLKTGTVSYLHDESHRYSKDDTIFVKNCILFNCDYGEYMIDTSQLGQKAIIIPH